MNSQSRPHDFQLDKQDCLIDAVETPKAAAAVLQLIYTTLVCLQRTRLDLAFLRPFLTQSRIFSDLVPQNKLSALLSQGKSFLWHTQSLFSGLLKNAVATKRCMSIFLDFPFLNNLTRLYPFLSQDLRYLFLDKLYILPKLLTKYKFSYPITGLNFSRFNIICILYIKLNILSRELS